jgi:hypothetical protein
MAIRQTNSKNSALKHTPSEASTQIRHRHALIMRKLEQNLMKLGFLDYAGEAKMNRLIAGFLRTNGHRTRAKMFSQTARCNAIMARSCRGK